MKLDNKVTMALEDFSKFDNDEDFEFAYATVDFLSNRPNSHKHIYSEKVIKQYAPTIINKWVIAEYDPFTKDATTHTNNQKIVGRVPEQEVKYRYDEDGYLVASVDVVISKLYATDVYEIFKTNNKRAVSIEELVGFTDETNDIEDGFAEKEIIGFNITGVTILGLSVSPSIPKANIQMIQMSEDSINSIEKEYIEYSQKSSNVETDFSKEILAKLESIENKLNLDKEENMPDIIEKEELESVVNAEETQNVVVENSEDKADTAKTVEENKEEMMSDEEVSKMAEKSSESTEKEDVTNACGGKEKVENGCDEKVVEMEKELMEAKETISKYEKKIAELEEFKSTVENSEKDSIITATMAQIKDFVEEETYSKYLESGNACEYANINSWKNEVLASIADKALAKMSELSSEDGVLDMGMPKETETKTSIYD